MLSNWLERDGEVSLPRAQDRFEEEGISIFPVPLGVQGEIGMIVVGSDRASFPSQIESLLLSVAASQASIGLARQNSLASRSELPANSISALLERTAELAAANEELQKESLERELAEERLRHEEKELKRSEAHKAAILELPTRLRRGH